MTELTLEQRMESLRAFTFGMNSALISAIGAIMKTHPDPTALRQALEAHRQFEQAHLESGPYPEHALDSYHQIWKRIEVDIPPAA
jgi:hypothetical protein